jgi:hypothetical protein
MLYNNCSYCNQPKPSTDHKRCKKCATIKHDDSYSDLYRRWATFSRKILPCSWDAFKAVFADITTEELHLHNDRIYILSKSETSRLSNRVNPTTGYKRVYYSRQRDWYYWQINVDGKTYTKSNLPTADVCADDLDTWILDRDITATLSDGTQYFSSKAAWIHADNLRDKKAS